MMITKPCFKSRSVFKAVFSVGKNKIDTTAADDDVIQKVIRQTVIRLTDIAIFKF